MVTSKRFIIAVFSILLISSVVFSVILSGQIRNYRAEIQDHLAEIREQRDEIAYLERINGEEYVANVKNLESKLKFYEKYIVVVSDDGTKQYHTYGCSKFDGSSFWAFNIDAAVDKGYSPCSYCNWLHLRKQTLSALRLFSYKKGQRNVHSLSFFISIIQKAQKFLRGIRGAFFKKLPYRSSAPRTIKNGRRNASPAVDKI